MPLKLTVATTWTDQTPERGANSLQGKCASRLTHLCYAVYRNKGEDAVRTTYPDPQCRIRSARVF
jgi:hypothetical protein